MMTFLSFQTFVILICSTFFENAHPELMVRLTAAFDHPLAVGKGVIPNKTSARLHDPKTGVTYHRTNNRKLIRALSSLWDPVTRQVKCGKWFTTVESDTGFIGFCDPKNLLLPSAIRRIHNITYTIPRITGCQCVSYQHCTLADSGFGISIVVVPLSFAPRRNSGNKRREQRFYDFKVAPVNLAVPRIASGIPRKIIDDNVDTYDLVAHYIRSLFKVGECDEDIVVCIFPKERVISASVGNVALNKMLPNCLNGILSKAQQQLYSETGWLSSDDEAGILEREKAIGLTLANEEFIQKVMPTKHRRERMWISLVLSRLTVDISRLLLSRSANPCDPDVRKPWSLYEISGPAVIFGILLSVVASTLSKICRVFSNFIEHNYVPSGKEITDAPSIPRNAVCPFSMPGNVDETTPIMKQNDRNHNKTNKKVVVSDNQGDRYSTL